MNHIPDGFDAGGWGHPPRCEITPDQVMPIEVDLLGQRLFGDGLYWRLHLDGFPFAPTLRERIDDAVAVSGYLQQPNLGRLEILSADELEALLGEVDRAGASLSGLLNEFALDTELRRWTMRDYLIARRGGLTRTQFVEKEWKAITAELAQELLPAHTPPAPATTP